MTEREPPHPDTAPLKRALIAIKDLRSRLEVSERAHTEPIAVIGMSCRFPGAPDLGAFWELLERGANAIGPVPNSRWDANAYYDPNPEAPGRMYTREGGFLGDVDGFDAAFFGITPREANSRSPAVIRRSRVSLASRGICR